MRVVVSRAPEGKGRCDLTVVRRPFAPTGQTFIREQKGPIWFQKATFGPSVTKVRLLLGIKEVYLAQYLRI